MTAAAAIRAVVRGEVQDVGFRDATARRARELGVLGWVRNGEDGTAQVHAEGSQAAKPQWLLIKRRDNHARPRSDLVAEQPGSILGSHTPDEVREEKSPAGAGLSCQRSARSRTLIPALPFGN